MWLGLGQIRYQARHAYIHTSYIHTQCMWLGLRHVRYGARPQHIQVLGQVIISTLERAVGEEWTAEMDKAWTDLWQSSCKMMLEVWITMWMYVCMYVCVYV